MKIRSVCPSCGRYFGRWYGFRTQDVRCPGCGVMVKETGRTTAAAVALGLVVGTFLILANEGVISWLVFAAVAGGWMALGFYVHPFVVTYRQTSLGPVCRGCGYVLVGVRGERCPECGEAIDVAIEAGSSAGESDE